MSDEERQRTIRGESKEFAQFEAAMRQILTVHKVDILPALPKMFRERPPAKRTARKRISKNSSA